MRGEVSLRSSNHRDHEALGEEISRYKGGVRETVRVLDQPDPRQAMIDTTVVLHANLLYAEIPLSDIPRLVDDSYLPILETILENPEVRVVLNFSGFSLELLAVAV